jgi:hypothetical protein
LSSLSTYCSGVTINTVSLFMLNLYQTTTLLLEIDNIRTLSANIKLIIGMITVLIWQRACINLFITYFNIELKRTKLTSCTDTKLMDMSDRYRLRLLIPKRQQIFPRPISTLGLKPSGRYRSLGMKTILIWKRACIYL